MGQEHDLHDHTPGGLIDDDCPCAHCGYNLRGLQHESKCPECFTPVGRSVHGDLLRYADPQWLNRLRLGAVLSLWSIALPIGLAVVAMGLTFLLDFGFAFQSMSVLALVGHVLWVLAIFAITARDPRDSLCEEAVTWPKVVRVSALVGLFAVFPPTLSNLTYLEPTIVHTCLALRFATSVSVFGVLLFLSRFALRIPNDRLARSTRTVMWGMTSVSAGSTALTLVVSVIGPSFFATQGPGGAAGGLAPALHLLAFLLVYVSGAIFGIWYAVLLFKYKKAFTEAALQSRAIPARAESSDAAAVSRP